MVTNPAGTAPLTGEKRVSLAAFSATLRNEVDLATLSEHLVGVVQETMQPTHASLWLRQPSRTDTPSLQTGKPPL